MIPEKLKLLITKIRILNFKNLDIHSLILLMKYRDTF